MLSKNKDDSEIMEFCELTQEKLDTLKK
jgi:hypothetical protein